ASLYAQLGYEVEREYYFNDEGRQIDLLAESLWARICEQRGIAVPIPEGGYHGEYLIPIAAELAQAESVGDSFDDATHATLREQAVMRMTAVIRHDLDQLGVHFDSWFSETALHRRGDVDNALQTLREHGGTYCRDGAEWLAAEAHGGQKDSVLVRSDGRPTYLLVDIAYHLDKRRRGLDEVIDVQGADHQIEQDSVLTALRLLGFPESFLRYAVHQFVSLREGGQTLRMSTRAGRFVQLSDLTEELGPDIVRYFMIARRPSTHLEFDLDLARRESLDNPVTYIQYAHTRISSIFRKVPEGTIRNLSAVELAPLAAQVEREMIRQLDAFPDLVRQAATEFSPHLIAEYALSLSRSFHAYYADHRILGVEERTSAARLALIEGLRLVLHRCLTLLGMRTPEVM
ncbi:arginine--tRNA ligase, partial [Candidatus Bipolaricaulota bacterium]|nr:arginine--tRNA ligase [Candidatus Bipolaricaulota bacterium]